MKFTFTTLIVIISTFCFCQTPPSSEPLFLNSVVSTEIDFIISTDEDAFISMSYVGRENKEMPDSRNDILFDRNTFIFEAEFENNKKVGIWCHSSFGDRNSAEEYADKLCPRLGKLPENMRALLSHVVIHKGDAGAFGESEGRFFVLYSDNMDTRISNNDLEETVFHESVHASLDLDHANTAEWLTAQTDDVNFITNYARDRANKEDLAETALFAYTMFKHPGRLSPEIENWVNTHIPNRINYIRTYIFPANITSVEDKTQNKNTYLFPNPINNTLTVNIEDRDARVTATILKPSGKIVETFILDNGTSKIDLSNLKNGVYYISIPNYSTEKFIKK